MMTNKQLSATKIRRERPAKPVLTQRGIIDAALAILHNEGLNKVTMCRIVEALDTGPASLYVYVRNAADLHAPVLDALQAAITESSTAEGTWRDRLKQLLTWYALVLFQYPEIARMTLTTRPSGQNYLAHSQQRSNSRSFNGRSASWKSDRALSLSCTL